MVSKIVEETPVLKDCLTYTKDENLMLNVLDTICYAKHQLSSASKILSLAR